MTLPAKPYGEINSFPIAWPVVVLLLSTLSAVFGAWLPASANKQLSYFVTFIWYAVIPISLISHGTFKYLVLPALNRLARMQQTKSYFLHTCVVLLFAELLFIGTLISFYGLERLDTLLVMATVLTALVAFNCAGHFWLFSRQSEMPNPSINPDAAR